jgi:hypothetical protein
VPNASSTQSSSASDTSGSPIPLSYGYVLATGKRDKYWQLIGTGDNESDYHRIGIWLLGHGEWDGCTSLQINDVFVWNGNIPSTPPQNNVAFTGYEWVQCLDNPSQPMVFNFHSGCDSVIGSGLTPTSQGPDQGCDILNSQFPAGIQPLCYSRIAYYAIMRKQPIENQTNTHQNDPTQWTDINPIGLWRSTKTRLFDGAGNMTGYAFSTNPAWHFVDVILRRKLFPDYSLPVGGGPDPLPAAVSARFNWESIYESAQYFDGVLANGRRRFAGSYSFAQATSLQAILSQMLLVCRSFARDEGGQIYLICDMPRPVSFTISRQHVLPGSWQADDKNLNTAANRYIATFRNLLIPAAATIASITAANQQNPIVTTDEPHPFNANDWIAMGGTGTIYDGEWQVATVPDVIDPGTPEAVYPTTLSLVRKGANYPTSVGAGGAMGLLYSRFKNRSVEFWHKTNMLARGALGLGIVRQRNKIKQTLDFATATYDQASRITRYERDRALGIDQTPYITPAAVTLKLSMFAKDAAGNLAGSIRPGAHVVIDDTASWTYQGDYEVLEPLTITPPRVQAESSNGSIALSPDSNSGEIEWKLGPYNEAIMYDSSDDLEAGWPDVPGSDPGNDGAFTSVDLANGGNFVFFSGQLASGSQFQLPSSGYPSQNMIAWASAAGTNVNFHSMRIIQLCDSDADRNLSLIYSDLDGNQWGGDENFACLTWLSPDVTFVQNGITWLQLTLLGGEVILFGKGILADGSTIVLPAGFSFTDGSGNPKAFALAFMHDMPDIVRNIQSIGAYVDASGVVHLVSTDSGGTEDYGNVAVLVFAWQNNMGTVATSTTDGATWMQVTLTNAKVFGVGCAKSQANGATFFVPTIAGDQTTLMTIAGSSNGTITSGNHAQGVGACFVDQEDEVHITFNDGSGDIWDGNADVLASFCVAGSAIPVIVTINPAYIAIGQSSIQTFIASVLGSTNQAVTWSVDGIAGGNATVGTIDINGNYTAPLSSGNHTITATSAANSAVSASATVYVTAAQSGIMFSLSGPTLTLEAGSQTIPVAVASSWRLASGNVSLVAGAAGMGGAYIVTVSWSGITAIAPNGSTLNYTDGSSAMPSGSTANLFVIDPNNVGGNLVALSVNAMAPTGAQVLLSIGTLPSAGDTENFGL